MTKYASLIALCAAFIAYVTWRRRSHLLEHPLLDERIQPAGFEPVKDYLDFDSPLPYEDFWTLSGGLKGLRFRFSRMVLIVRNLQHQVRAKRLSQEDAHCVWQSALKQVFCTLVAFPEAAVCAVFPELPHAYGQLALRYHHEVSTRAFTACSTEDAGPEILRLL